MKDIKYIIYKQGINTGRLKVKNWSDKDYNSELDKNRYSIDEIILQDFKENI